MKIYHCSITSIDGGKEKSDSVASTASPHDDSKDKHESVAVDSSLATTPTTNTTVATVVAPPLTKLNFETTKLNFETTKLNFEADKVVTTTMTEATKTSSTSPPDEAAPTANNPKALTASIATSSASNANFMNVTIINTVNGVKAELMPALNSEASGDAIVMDKENVSHLNSNANDADTVVKIEPAIR